MIEAIRQVVEAARASLLIHYRRFATLRAQVTDLFTLATELAKDSPFGR